MTAITGYTAPRGECPVCGADVALTAAGQLRKHRRPKPGGQRSTTPCPGPDDGRPVGAAS